MALAPGVRLGPYEIVSALGAGGMGEVYKARDTRLDRTVAIKVLPEHVASNPALKQRFEREAKTISSLNHPHQRQSLIGHDHAQPEVLEFKRPLRPSRNCGGWCRRTERQLTLNLREGGNYALHLGRGARRLGCRPYRNGLRRRLQWYQ